MKKKNGTVQAVVENSPSPESKTVEPEASGSGSDATVEALPVPEWLKKVDPQKIAMAEKFGIPIGDILNWMQSVEIRFNQIEKTFPEQVGAELEKAIQRVKANQPSLSPSVMAEPQASAPSSSVGNMMSILPVVAEMIKGGGSQDSEMSLMAKEALKSQIDMSKAITQAVVSKILASATSSVAAAVA